MNLMIVDDSPAVRNIIKELLLELTDEIYECGDGASAVDIYNKKKPDLVLMDIKMLGMNGLEATKHIIKFHPDAKIVMVSNYYEKEFRDAAINAGAIEFVDKKELSSLPRIVFDLVGNLL